MCTIVPFSATAPRSDEDHDVLIPAGSYRGLTKSVWAKCASLTVVSHARLDRPLAGRSYVTEALSDADMKRIEAGIRAALGLP